MDFIMEWSKIWCITCNEFKSGRQEFNIELLGMEQADELILCPDCENIIGEIAVG